VSTVDVASPKNAVCTSSQRDMANSPAHPLKIYQELHREEHQGKPGKTASGKPANHERAHYARFAPDLFRV